MREQIAVLDGLSMASDGWAGGDYTPESGGGANYGGGSSWHPFNPTLPSTEGLAGLGSLGMDAYAGGSFTPESGSGANYGGGSSWHPFNPTLPSSEGLAGGLSMEIVPGYAGEATIPVPGNGQNYTGGSDWSARFPTKLPSEGLVGVRGRSRRGSRGLRYAPPTWTFPLYDSREKRVTQLVACGVRRMHQAIFGADPQAETVRSCVQVVMSRVRNAGRMDALFGASAADVAYIGALYVADKHTNYMGWRGPDAKTRARAAAQACG